MTSSRRWIIFSLWAFLGLAGCSGDLASTEIEFPESCWHIEDALTLDYTGEEATGDIVIPVQFNDEYGHQNIWLMITIDNHVDTARSYLQQYFLMDKTGSWYSEDMKFEFPAGVEAPSTGPFTVVVRHYMRDDEICGVVDAGIKIKHSK